MCARFAVLNDTPIASAIAGCVIPISRSSTIWIRWRWSGRPFHRRAVFNRRTWPLVHLTICSLRIRWSKNHTSRRRENPGHARHAAPQQFRFNQIWKWYNAQEKRVKHIAERKGFRLDKAGHGKGHGRFYIMNLTEGGRMRSGVLDH